MKSGPGTIQARREGGVAAALTTASAMAFDGEPAALVKVLLLLGIVGCVAGLKVLR